MAYEKLKELIVKKQEYSASLFKVGDWVYLSDKGLEIRICRSSVGVVTKIPIQSMMIEVWPVGYHHPQQYHMVLWTTVRPLKNCPMCKGSGKNE